MIEYIELIGISDELIQQMIDKLGYDEVLNLACNYKLVKSNIEMLKSWGIKVIDELLLNKSDLFKKEPNEIIEKFSKSNIPNIIETINNDYTIIDELL